MPKHEAKIILETLRKRVNVGSVTPGYLDYATARLLDDDKSLKRHRRLDLDKWHRR